MHPVAERALSHIRHRDLLRAGDRVGVAVSGGVDSVALLRLLLELRHELGIVLSVVHLNHKLRGTESDGDQEFVSNLARQHDLELHAESGDVAQEAARERISIEAAAREARYRFFRHLMGDRGACDSRRLKSKIAHLSNSDLALTLQPVVSKIATGHTLDDQAETVLLRVIRGTGLKGLGGIYPRIVVEGNAAKTSGEIVRPLLALRRRELEQYLKELNQPWREDSTNSNTKFTRNRLRQLVLPLLEREFNPAVTENLAELSEIARGEEDYWKKEITASLDAVGSEAVLIHAKAGNVSVNLKLLLAEPIAVQRRLIKTIGDELSIPLEFKHVEEIRGFADEPSGKQLSIPAGWKVKREPEGLLFVTPAAPLQEKISEGYEYELRVPGRTAVPEAHIAIEALNIAPGSYAAGYNPEHLLDPELLHVPLRVRNWRPGDRFWPAHTKAARKIKELLQERHIPQPERKLWPVIANGQEIVWVRGFPVAAKLRAKPERHSILILERPLTEDSETRSE